MSEVPGEDDANHAAPRAPIYPPDELLRHVIENAIDPTTRLKACLYLAFLDRCAGQPIDKNEAAVFEASMAAVLTTLKLSVVKGGKD
jgi:hypothetical protein